MPPPPQEALTDALPELPTLGDHGYRSNSSIDRGARKQSYSPEQMYAYARQYAAQCIEARNQQGDADGERYRWLKENVDGGSLGVPGGWMDTDTETWDAEIDAAIEQRKADKKVDV